MQYAPCIASCGGRYFDAVSPTILRVDVVEADGRRCDQFDGRSFEQGGIAPGAGTDDQGVGIPDIGRCDGFPGEVFHPGIRFEYSFQKRYGIVGDDFHDGIRIG